MKTDELKNNEEVEKIFVLPGDVVFVKYLKAHRPYIHVFREDKRKNVCGV